MITTLLALLALLAEPHAAERRLTPICGVWDGDQLLAAYTPDYHPDDSTAAFLRGPSDDARAADPARPGGASYLCLTPNMRGGVCKVSVAAGRVWLVAPGCAEFFVLPTEDLQYLEDSAWGERLRARKFGRDADWPRRYAYDAHTLFFRPAPGELASADEPLKGAKYALTGLPLGAFEQQVQFVRHHARYDVIPTGAESLTLVSLRDGNVVFEDLVLKAPGPGGKVPGALGPASKSRKRSARAPFDGDFWAYEVGGTYYLLTHAGKLFAARPKGGKDGELEVTAVWDKKDRPLAGAVHDVARGKVFAFGLDGAGGRFVFELALRPDPAWYRTRARPTDGFREAQDGVTAAAKFLLGQ